MGKSAKNSGALPFIERESFGKRLARNYKEHKVYYWLAVPIIAYYIIFHYLPMFGVVIAFQNYRPAKGLLGSSWVGLKHFKAFFDSIYAGRLIKNTLMINLLLLIFSFPAPIILALLLNEVKAKHFKKTVQTISYMPHFISMVVICGLLVDFCSSTGIITSITTLFGAQRDNLLNRPELFRTIYVSSDIWQSIGWGSIIYLATLAGVDAELYEAATIDGAGRLKQTIHVTIPSIMPTIVILFILRLGGILNVGYEKIMLLTNAYNAETSEVLSYYVYKKGIMGTEYGLSTAAGVFNSVINFVFLIATNALSRKLNETSLW